MAQTNKTVVKGATSVSVPVRVLGTVSFAPQTSFAETSFDLFYWREGAGNWVSFAPAAISFLSSAWAAGGVEPIAEGYYRIDVPDAAFAKAVGVNSVLIHAKYPGNVFCEGAFVTLVDSDKAPYAKTPEVY